MRVVRETIFTEQEMQLINTSMTNIRVNMRCLEKKYAMDKDNYLVGKIYEIFNELECLSDVVRGE